MTYFSLTDKKRSLTLFALLVLATTRDTKSAYNGFGQMVWQWVGPQNGSATTISANYYHPSGELKYKWEGNKENQTNYTYDTSGRVATIQHGIRISDTSVTAREQLTFTYDGFGRVSEQKADGEFITTMQYDTLDRTVETIQPNGVKVETQYAISGKPSQVKTTEGTLVVTEKNSDIDSFGNVGLYEYSDTEQPTNGDSLSSKSKYQIETKFDDYDRPIKIRDWRLLSVVNLLDNISQYMVYDSYGRLIKQLEPVLANSGNQSSSTMLPSATGNWYTDLHRPYSEMTYDVLGRKVSESKLLQSSSPVLPSSLITNTISNMPSGDVAISQIQYDGFDRPVKSIDPEGYSTKLKYDNSDNPIKRTQEICKLSDQVCYASATSINIITTEANTFMYYDATGKPVQVIDPRSYLQKMGYNTLGQPTFTQKSMTVDGTVGLVTSKIMGYTKDGLLEVEAEPDNSVGTPATDTTLGANNTVPSGFVTTKKLEYGTRAYPISQKTQAPNIQTGDNPTNTTTFTNLDYAGRPKTTTLPGGATITRQYDARGNVTKLIDAEGFETQYEFDAGNRLIKEFKVARATDSAAFPNGFTGLISTYDYDAMGNLYKRTEQGRTVYYAYNSLGKVIAESRPLLNLSAAPHYKISAYRLDGQKILETTHDIRANNIRGATDLSAWETSAVEATGVNVVQGGTIWYAYDKRGLQTVKTEIGIILVETNAFGDIVNVPVKKMLSRSSYSYNGLGLKIRRDFTGDTPITFTGKNIAVYVRPLRADGTRANNADTSTYWNYDPAGLLISSWDQVGGETAKQNVFEYAYTATGKQKEEIRDVVIKADGNTTPTLDLKLGASKGKIDSKYNERDQLIESVVTEEKLRSKDTLDDTQTITRTNNYTYNTDGSRASEAVAGQGTRSFTYDARGRETIVLDSNGAPSNYNIASGSTTTTTTYSSNGDTSVRMTDSVKCKSRTDTKVTIAGLTTKRSEWTWEGLSPNNPNGNPAPRDISCDVESDGNHTTITYNANGTQNTTTFDNPVNTTKLDTTYVIDDLGGPTSGPKATTGLLYIRNTDKTTGTVALTYNDYGDVSTQVQTSNTLSTGIEVRNYKGYCQPGTNPSDPSEFLTCIQTFTWGPMSAQDNDFGYTIPKHNQGNTQVLAQTYPAGTAVPQVTGEQFTGLTTFPQPSDPNLDPQPPQPADIWVQTNNLGGTIISTNTQTNTYNTNGDLSNESKIIVNTVPNSPVQTTKEASTYALDAMGRRLATKDTLDANGTRISTNIGKYAEFTKRYNPDGQTAEFNRAPKGADGGSGYINSIEWYNTYILAFRYDPQGQQILSADSGISDFNNQPNTHFVLNRQTYATYSSDGEVQMISARGGVVKDTRGCAVGFIFCFGTNSQIANTWDNPANNEDNGLNDAKSYARVYDRTFGLADGLKSKSWSVQQPFDIITPKSGQLALETPQTAQSTTLGLNPVTVAAPNTVSSPPVNPVTVTPPVITAPNSGSSTTPATPAAQSTPQASNTPVSSNPSPTITAPPIGSTTPPVSSNPTPAVSSPTAQPIALPAPVNTLPSAVSSAVSPTSVQSPLSSSVPIVNPISVTAPNQVTPPIVGSSSAVSVVAPVSSVPVNPITVKPPSSAVVAVSSSKPNGVIVRALYFAPLNGRCAWFGDTNYDYAMSRADECEPSSIGLDEKADWLAKQVQNQNGDSLKRAKLELAKVLMTQAKRDVETRVGKDLADEVETYRAFIFENPEAFSPDMALGMALAFRLCMAVCPASEIRVRLTSTAKVLREYVQGTRSLRADFAAGRILNLGGALASRKKEFDTAMNNFMFGTGVQDTIQVGGNTDPLGWLDIFDILGVMSLATQLLKSGIKAVAKLGINSIFKGGKLMGRNLGGMLGRALRDCLTPNSFTANTKVWVSQTANDLASKTKSMLEKTKTAAKTALTAVAISSITIGTQVLAHNEQTKLESPQEVTATINHTDPITVKLTLETNTGKLEVIEATPEHPFFALLEPNKKANGIWVNAGELQPNNWLRRANGETGIVKKLEWLTQTKRMYNLTVARDSTFFVGEGQWLVHNQQTTYLIDTNILIAASRGDVNALALLKNGYITPSVMTEFLNVNTQTQKLALQQLLQSSGVQLVDANLLNKLAQDPEYLKIYNTLVNAGHSAVDAELAAIARTGNYTLLTAEKRLFNVLTYSYQQLGVPVARYLNGIVQCI